MTPLPVLLSVTFVVFRCTATLPTSLLMSSSYPPPGDSPEVEELLLTNLLYNAHTPPPSPRHRLQHRFRLSEKRAHSQQQQQQQFQNLSRDPEEHLSSRLLALNDHLSRRRQILGAILKRLGATVSTRAVSALGRKHGGHDGSACLEGCVRRRMENNAKPLVRSARLEGTTFPPSLYLLGGAVGR
ncbi:uncharacterized protein LOC143286480 [Babylonia areolata]|uniref:uncharacterized protein LOC143286480 n=1 Tax=Babylonia areolata TaxID=304850 RepID=UPI003FCF8258